MPRTSAELSRHRLVGYVPDLAFSPSLDYAEEFSADWEFSDCWLWYWH